MRVFDHPNMHDFTCPICGTSDDEPVVLIGIDGTQEGHVMEAVQVHVRCLNLTIQEEKGIIYQIIPKKEATP